MTIHRNTNAVLATLADARRRWEQHERHHEQGIASLAYCLFESLVDGYFAVQDRVRERMEVIEESFLRGAEGAAADLFRLREGAAQGAPAARAHQPRAGRGAAAGGDDPGESQALLGSSTRMLGWL